MDITQQAEPMAKVHFRPLTQIIFLVVHMDLVITLVAILTPGLSVIEGVGTYFGTSHPNYVSAGHSGSGFYSGYTMQGYGSYYGTSIGVFRLWRTLRFR